MLELRSGFEIAEGQVVRVLEGAELGDDDLSELVVDVRMAAQGKQSPSLSCQNVRAGEQDRLLT